MRFVCILNGSYYNTGQIRKGERWQTTPRPDEGGGRFYYKKGQGRQGQDKRQGDLDGPVLDGPASRNGLNYVHQTARSLFSSPPPAVSGMIWPLRIMGNELPARPFEPAGRNLAIKIARTFRHEPGRMSAAAVPAQPGFSRDHHSQAHGQRIKSRTNNLARLKQIIIWPPGAIHGDNSRPWDLPRRRNRLKLPKGRRLPALQLHKGLYQGTLKCPQFDCEYRALHPLLNYSHNNSLANSCQYFGQKNEEKPDGIPLFQRKPPLSTPT